ncbi:MAG: hypothetical protein NTZ18_03755 [Candidatus Komeilibacteria bacterium]|nr:hypothetical protein [Candidatus Komeilibacteria bacterium]
MGIKVNLGVIGAGLENISDEKRQRLLTYKDFIEPFNHSWGHRFFTGTKKELFGTDHDYQLESITKTNLAIKQVFDFNCQAIGFPANACDDTTIKILSQIPEIHHVFYLKTFFQYQNLLKIKPIIDVNGYGVLENPTGVDYEKFVRSLAEVEAPEGVITFQLHPSMWSVASFAEFVKCIEYLKSKNSIFIFASEL